MRQRSGEKKISITKLSVKWTRKLVCSMPFITFLQKWNMLSENCFPRINAQVFKASFFSLFYSKTLWNTNKIEPLKESPYITKPKMLQALFDWVARRWWLTSPPLGVPVLVPKNMECMGKCKLPFTPNSIVLCRIQHLNMHGYCKF